MAKKTKKPVKKDKAMAHTTTKGKKAAPRAAKKTAKKSVASVKKSAATKKTTLAGKAQRIVKTRLTELLDRRLLEIASKQYARVLREVAKGRKRIDRRIDDEKKLALQLGERIIAKAREVKASLTSK
jgi:hypothetical protein